MPPRDVERAARRVLHGVGDARLGEWVEYSRAVHVRRRLSVHEAALVGPVVDIRGTDEAVRRTWALGDMLRHVPATILVEEAGVVP